ASQVAVSEESVVLLVGVGLDDGGLDLAANFCRMADGNGVLDGGVLNDPCLGPQVRWTAKKTVGPDAGVFVQQHGTLRGVGNAVLAERGALGGKNAVGNFAEPAAFEPVRKAVGKDFEIVPHDVVRK